MKKLISFTALCMAIFVSFCTAASAQNPEKQPTPEELAATETEHLENALKLEDWQVFYVDSTLQHDFAALEAELKEMQAAKVGNYDMYRDIQDKWMEQIDNSFKKWFTPAQWKKYLKMGAGKSQKEREKRRAKIAKANKEISE
ncbi:MAG: hypothetical protein IJ543_00380 [Bacteroidales bacterium]|nr:hypothetical protein [Bacteroidales bacterium]